MESIVVTTLAGCGLCVSRDGDGTSAAFDGAEGCCYSPLTDTFLIAESAAHRIRRIYPVTENRRADIKQSLESLLIERGALPVHDLISIVLEFAIGANSMCLLFSQSTPPACWMMCCV